MTMGRTHEEVSRSLTNQPPQSDLIAEGMATLRVPFKVAARAVLDLVPAGREQSLALTKIEEAVMWAIKGIALHQDEIPNKEEVSQSGDYETVPPYGSEEDPNA